MLSWYVALFFIEAKAKKKTNKQIIHVAATNKSMLSLGENMKAN